MPSGSARLPLDPQRWQKLTDLFDSLVGLPAAERAARLRELCAGDETLRAQAESLLGEADREGLLDRSAAETCACASQVLEASSSLSSQSEKLKDAVVRFLAAVRAA